PRRPGPSSAPYHGAWCGTRHQGPFGGIGTSAIIGAKRWPRPFPVITELALLRGRARRGGGRRAGIPDFGIPDGDSHGIVCVKVVGDHATVAGVAAAVSG